MPGAAIVQTRADVARVGADELVAFAGCNYLGLAHDPRVLGAVRDATERFGLSTSASRETSGNTPAHEELERALVGFIGGGAAGDALDGVLVPDGYTANLAAAQGLAATHAVALIDRRAHASLADAARGAGMTVGFYGHRDAEDLRTGLAAADGPAVVMTDGVFTADGSVAPLEDLLGAMRGGDVLLVDDCHGFAVLGGGRGSLAHAGIGVGPVRGRVVVTTTLAKGLGGGGGIVLGDPAWIERVRASSHAYVCTTPVSPLVAAGTLAALEILCGEPDRLERLAANARRLRAAMGAPASPVPICAHTVDDRAEGEALSARLRGAGLFVPAMAYPGGPTEWYLRASVTSEHEGSVIDRLAGFFGEGSGGGG